MNYSISLDKTTKKTHVKLFHFRVTDISELLPSPNRVLQKGNSKTPKSEKKFGTFYGNCYTSFLHKT